MVNFVYFLIQKKEKTRGTNVLKMLAIYNKRCYDNKNKQVFDMCLDIYFAIYKV